MAKKKVDENAQVKKAVKKAVKKTAKKTVKKAMRGDTKAIIAIIAVLVIIAIAVAAVYFVAPEVFDFILNPSADNGNSEVISGGSGINSNSNSGVNGDSNSGVDGGISGIDGNTDSDVNDGNNGSGGSNGSLLDGVAEGDLVMYALDCGQGDCIYIQFPDGKDMLIDAGNERGSNLANYNGGKLAQMMDELVSDDTLDYLMLTHADADHVSYLDEVLALYQVNEIYMPNIKAENNIVTNANLDSAKIAMFTDTDTITTNVYASFFVAALTEPNCNIHLNIGQFTISGTGWKIDFFGYTQEEWDNTNLSNAEKKNAVSPVGILQCNNRRVVLTGDSNEMNEDDAVEKIKAFYSVDKLDCDILKVGHHGSETSSTVEFLDFITCEYAVCSCGTGNSYEHPRFNTLIRLANRDTSLYRTDLQGYVKVVIKTDTTIAFTTEVTDVTDDDLWTGFYGVKEDGNTVYYTKKAVKGDNEI